MPNSAPKTSTGFVGLQDYLNANQDATKRMTDGVVGAATDQAQQGMNAANTVADSVYNQAKAQGAGNTFDPTQTAGYAGAGDQLTKASQQVKGLGTFGGDAQQINAKYGAGYSTPQAFGGGGLNLDANLMGAGGQGQIQAAQKQFGGLDTYLSDHANKSQQAGYGAYTPPPTAAAPAPAPAAPTVTKRDPEFNPGVIKNDPMRNNKYGDQI